MFPCRVGRGTGKPGEPHQNRCTVFDEGENHLANVVPNCCNEYSYEGEGSLRVRKRKGYSFLFCVARQFQSNLWIAITPWKVGRGLAPRHERNLLFEKWKLVIENRNQKTFGRWAENVWIRYNSKSFLFFRKYNCVILCSIEHKMTQLHF